LLNLVQRRSTEQWRELYQRCRRDPRVARELAAILPMRDPDLMASARLWKWLLEDLSGGDLCIDLHEEDREVGV
jgi:hypothetical protein